MFCVRSGYLQVAAVARIWIVLPLMTDPHPQLQRVRLNTAGRHSGSLHLLPSPEGPDEARECRDQSGGGEDQFRGDVHGGYLSPA